MCCAFVGVCDCVLLLLINECVLFVKCCVRYYVVCVLVCLKMRLCVLLWSMVLGCMVAICLCDFRCVLCVV